MNNIRLLLVASLAINLFLAGWWIGDQMRRPSFGGPPGPQMMRYSDRASGEERALMGETLEKLDTLIKAGFDQRSAIFEEARELIKQEPFDEAAFDALLAKLPEQRMTQDKAQWAIIRETILKLSTEDRQAVAEVFFLPPGPPPGGNMPPPPGGNMPPPFGQPPPPR